MHALWNLALVWSVVVSTSTMPLHNPLADRDVSSEFSIEKQIWGTDAFFVHPMVMCCVSVFQFECPPSNSCARHSANLPTCHYPDLIHWWSRYRSYICMDDCSVKPWNPLLLPLLLFVLLLWMWLLLLWLFLWLLWLLLWLLWLLWLLLWLLWLLWLLLLMWFVVVIVVVCCCCGCCGCCCCCALLLLLLLLLFLFLLLLLVLVLVLLLQLLLLLVLLLSSVVPNPLRLVGVDPILCWWCPCDCHFHPLCAHKMRLHTLQIHLFWSRPTRLSTCAGFFYTTLHKKMLQSLCEANQNM